MPPSGTFEYLTTVPEGGVNAFPWTMRSREHFKSAGDPVLENRLVGWNPLLYIRDTGTPPDPKLSHPAVYRSEIQLVATDKKYATSETASYFIDRSLVGVLKPGDILHIARTGCGGVGLSAVRQGKLIFAAGQVTAVPLGSGVSVKIPRELLHRAEAIFRARDPGFEFTEYPVEVSICESPRIRFQGLLEMGDYHVWVSHGYIDGEPGTPECVSISLDEACKWISASASAQLLESRQR
jgi:hypothetical protein